MPEKSLKSSTYSIRLRTLRLGLRSKQDKNIFYPTLLIWNFDIKIMVGRRYEGRA